MQSFYLFILWFTLSLSQGWPRACYVTQVGLKFVIKLPYLPKYWNYKYVPKAWLEHCVLKLFSISKGSQLAFRNNFDFYVLIMFPKTLLNTFIGSFWFRRLFWIFYVDTITSFRFHSLPPFPASMIFSWTDERVFFSFACFMEDNILSFIKK